MWLAAKNRNLFIPAHEEVSCMFQQLKLIQVFPYPPGMRFFFFHYVAQARLELAILLPQLPKY
jgi:hypothetical protein